MISPVRRALGAALAALAALAAAASGPLAPAAHAQQTAIAIRGRVIDAAGQPVPGQQVMLHRVTEAGGGTVAQTVTDSAGAFELGVGEQSESGIFFVTTRWQGVVQVGPMLRPPIQTDSSYVLQVGLADSGLESSLPLSAGAAPPRPAGEVPFVTAALIALLASMTWIGLRSAGPSPRRRSLARLARIDDSSDGGVGTAERNRLIERIRST